MRYVEDLFSSGDFIIDNSKVKLVDVIKEYIKNADEVKFALGYFLLSGWDLLREDLPEGCKKGFLKIVIGDETSEATMREILEGYSERVKAKLLEEISSEENLERINELHDLIHRGTVDVRVYSKGKLHAKLYLFLKEVLEKDPSGVAIVGSSNLTAKGLAENKELNVLLMDKKIVSELNSWFDELWEESEEFREELLKILELAKNKKLYFGKLVSPRELFKVLVWKWFNGRIEPLKRKDILAEFQLIGVINAENIISKYNGVIIADSVGLGKSFIGAAIIEEYVLGKLQDWDPRNYGINKERKALLILPPSIISQWEYLLFGSGYFFTSPIIIRKKSDNRGMLEYEIYQKLEKGITKLGEVALLSVARFSRFSEKEIIEIGKLNYEYDLILIDEAHKFRNRQTKRWKNARSLRFKDPKNSFQNKFILLTATPLNNTIWDLYNLIKIFSDNSFSKFKLDGTNVTQIFQEFRDIKKKWRGSPKEFEGELRKKAQEIKERVLDKIMILRTRKYIMENFGKEGKIKIGDKELIFRDPKPEKISYANISKYKEYWDFLNDVHKLLENLRFAYTKLYSSGFVIIGNSSSSLYAETSEEVEEESIPVPIEAILKLLLSKRLESSIFAFERTLDRIYHKNEEFYHCLSEFYKRTTNLPVEGFIRELDKLGNRFLEIAGKEDLLEKLSEEEDFYGEYQQVDPKVRMIVNFISKGLEKEISVEELLKGSQEAFIDVVFEKIKSNGHLFKALRKGIKETLNELKEDDEILSELKKKLQKLKIKDENGPKTVGKVQDEKGSYPIYMYKDPKLEKLKQLMYEELAGKKYVIFTQYKDTAEYLYHNLVKWLKRQEKTLTYLFDAKRGSLKIELVTGDTDIENKVRIIKRFAPNANNGRGEVEKFGEIMILVSTDSLSEGVNLQDGDGVINYDLPWNPMKIVQRVGRISRIGNEKEIFVKNFVPAKEIEISLGILAKLQEKIKDITLLVGKEFYILSADEEEISIETFGERLKNIAEYSLSKLEELSSSNDLRLISGEISKEVLAEFELLEFVQNVLGLKKEDFEDVQQLLAKNLHLYTLIYGEPKAIFIVTEFYRGDQLLERGIWRYEHNRLEKKSCKELIELWRQSTYKLAKEIDFARIAKILSEALDKINNYLKNKYKPSTSQRGLIFNLVKYLRGALVNSTLTATLNKEMLTDAINYLEWLELTTKEISKLKKYLVNKGAITEKGELKDVKILLEALHSYFNIGKISKKPSLKLIGWWC